MKLRLAVLDEEVQATTSRVLAERPEWPCTKGCDHCCRSLATPMRLSRAEWERIRDRLAASSRPADEASFTARLLNERTCALLDEASGACTVYDVRPIACRSYGFYAGRDGGRWCAAIEEAPGLSDGVVLGNHDALERSLTTLGTTNTLAEWLSRS